MNKILIRGLELSACHGCNPEEKVNPQKFIFDADITTDFYAAAADDDLNKTLNYSKICTALADVTCGNSFNLIEKLAYECAFSVMEKFEKARAVTLTVYKPEAPVKRKFESVGVSVSLEREKVYLSLGSSLGDRKAMLDTAIEKLNATRGVKVKKVSEYLSFAPYGGVAENEFLNCAAEIETFLSPYVLLGEIHRIEAECGRVRKTRWEDRTLDIDIIFFGDRRICSETLVVPHPDYMNRDFVKIPLKSIAPHLNQYKINN